jgi:hypothetical protein
VSEPKHSEKSVYLDREEHLHKGSVGGKITVPYYYDANSDTLNPASGDLQVGGSEVSEVNPVPISGTVTSTGAGLAVSEALTFTSYNLASAAYSGTTAVSNDYRLTSIELHFSTSQKRTITLTTEDGVVVFKDTDVTYLDRIVPFDTFFNGGEDLTLAITQTSGACTVTGKLTVAQGSVALEGNPVVEQAFPFNVRQMSRFYNIRGQRYLTTTDYVPLTGNLNNQLLAVFQNPADSAQVVFFDKAEFAATVNATFTRFGGGTAVLIGTPTARPIGRSDGGASSSVMKLYTGGNGTANTRGTTVSAQFSVSVAGTVRKVAVMQAYQQYQLNEIDGTIILQPGQQAYWVVDESPGGSASTFNALIDFEWIEMPLATYNNMVIALQAQADY